MTNTFLSMSPGIAVTSATGDAKPAVVSAILTLLIEIIRLFKRKRSKKVTQVGK